MEPMALGSPVGSPAAAQSGNASMYLPAFLMGDQQVPSTPRSNTLSPNKAGRNVSFGFAQSPVSTSPQDFNRSQIGQKTLFGGFQEQASSSLVGRNLVGTPNHNHSMAGPPTQGLFDSIRNETNAQMQSPLLARNTPQGIMGTPTSAFPSANPMAGQSFPQQPAMNDSYFTNNSLTSPRNLMQSAAAANLNTPNLYDNYNQQPNFYSQVPSPGPMRETDFWITVFGFPQSATTTIIQHFSQCGTIIDKVFPAQKGNWMHLKFSSRLECNKALNYNEKILANNIMIGVTYCKDRKVLDKENVLENNNNSPSVNTPVNNRPKIRSLVAHTPDSSAVQSPNAPQKASGLMNKAMDLFFGW